MSFSITQNTTILTGASILQKIVSLVYFTIVARFLGAEQTSQYFLALSFALIFTVVADFGLTPVLTREISKYPERARDYLNSIFWVKLLLGAVSYLLITTTANLFGYDQITKQLIYVAGLTVFFDNLTSAGYAFMRAQKNLIYESSAMFLSQLTTLIAGGLALYLHAPLFFLVGAYTLPSFINFWICLIYLKFKYQVVYEWRPQKEIFKMFLFIAIPFALAGIINRFYSYTDTLIMSKILTPAELGYWSVPYKIIFAFQFIPAALTVSAFPVLSRSFLDSADKVEELFRKAWHYLLLISVPMAFGLLVVSRPLILTLYKAEYLPSVLALQILGFALVFIFLGYINGALLNAINRQKLQTVIVAIAWGISIVLNLILIPKYGIYGSAYTALISNIFFCGCGYFFINKFIRIKHKEVLKLAFKSVLSAVVMAVVVYFVENKVNFYLAVPVGIIVYGLMIFLTGAVNKQMVKDNLIKIGIIKIN